MSAGDRAYRLLLRAYPMGFRAQYEREMTLVFRDRRREMPEGMTFWSEIVWDVVRSAPTLHVEASRSRWRRSIHLEEGKMLTMTMAFLAILVGSIESVGSLQEAWFGGIQNRDGWSLVGGTMGAVAGGLIVAAGIALIRRAQVAVALARGAAVTCLTVFALLALFEPRMSIFATMLGIGFPIVLLLFLWTRGRGIGAPMMA